MIQNTGLAIVIVTHNRCASLQRTLDRLQALPEACQIVVVDNASTDATATTLQQRYPQIGLLRLEKNMGAAARNLGMRMAQYPVVAFCDDDSWWAAGALAEAAALFAQYPRLAVIMSRIVVGPQHRADPCCELMRRSPLPCAGDLPGIPILGFVACGAVVRRSAFLSTDGFHERFGIGGEEELLAIDLARHGWGLSYLPTIVSHHHPSRNRDPQRRQVTAVRNALWTAWLRRSPSYALRLTLRQLLAARSDRDVLLGMAEALRGIPWVVRQRVAIPIQLEQQLLRLEQDALQR